MMKVGESMLRVLIFLRWEIPALYVWCSLPSGNPFSGFRLFEVGNTCQTPKIQVQTHKYKFRHPKYKSRHSKYKFRHAKYMSKHPKYIF